MRRDEVQGLIRRIPEADHTKVVLVLTGGQAVNLDAVFRFEPEYVIVRGREIGSNDEGRAFFLPYAGIAFVKIERTVKLEELEAMYGGGKPAAVDKDGAAGDRLAAAATPAPAVTPAPGPALDPATIAKQNLLDRIRAARTSAVSGSTVRSRK